jgi:hypothetical protein
MRSKGHEEWVKVVWKETCEKVRGKKGRGMALRKDRKAEKTGKNDKAGK